jgi:hypothetical protein
VGVLRTLIIAQTRERQEDNVKRTQLEPSIGGDGAAPAPADLAAGHWKRATAFLAEAAPLLEAIEALALQHGLAVKEHKRGHRLMGQSVAQRQSRRSGPGTTTVTPPHTVMRMELRSRTPDFEVPTELDEALLNLSHYKSNILSCDRMIEHYSKCSPSENREHTITYQRDYRDEMVKALAEAEALIAARRAAGLPL